MSNDHLAPAMSTQTSVEQLLGMVDAARRRMDAKLQILKDLELYRKAHGYTQSNARQLFCAAYNRGDLAVGDQARQAFSTLSPKTVEKWQHTLRNDGIAALSGRYGKTRGRNCIDAQARVRDHIVGFLVKFPHAQTTRAMEFLQARLGSSGLELPSQRTLQRWIGAWKEKNHQTYTAIINPDQWKSSYKAAFGSCSEHILRLNQLWELDSTPADLMLSDGRHTLAGGIDVYSRRLTLLVTRTARSSANNEMLRRKILAEGAPESVKTDQGKDYVSREFETFLAAVDIDHLTSNKFSPWEKPHIERAFRTFSHDLVELMPGYCGHNVADAQALRSRQSFAEQLFCKGAVVEITMTAAEMQKFCDEWCSARYHHRAHEGLDGKTPMQMVAEWPHPIQKIADERALDLLLLEVPTNNGRRVVQKKGIRLPDGWYVAPELEAFIGRDVQCRYLDAGRVVVYALDPYAFVCIAVEPDLAGLSRKEIAAKTREVQKRRVQEERAALRAVEKSITPQDAAAEILRDNAIAAGKLVMLPRRGNAVTTEALAAARDALDEIEAPARDSSSLISADDFAAARAAVEHQQLVPTPMFDSPQQRAFWLSDQSFKRALTGEEQATLDDFRRLNPRIAQDMDQMMTMRHGRAALKSV